MTLIVGLRCTDGVVLAADTEESTPLTRGRTRKLLTNTFPNQSVVAIAGSGSGDLIDSAVEQIFEAVTADGPTTVADLKATIRKTLLRFYREEIQIYPTRDPLDLLIDLVCAVRSPDKNFALYKASGPAISSVPGFALLGSGAVMRHVLEELYQPTITVQRGIALALHLLSLGKRHVTGVGGDTHIVTITSQGIPFQEPVGEIQVKEQYLDGFNHLFGELLLQFPDGSISPEAFTKAMEHLTKTAGELRQEQLELLAKEMIQHPPEGGWPRPPIPLGTVISSNQVIAPSAPAPTPPPTTPPVAQKQKAKQAKRQAPRGPKRGR